MRLVNSILLVGEGRIEGTDGKRMCLGRLVAIGPDRRIKGPQGLVIKIIQVIPEQAQIKARTLGKIERLGKVVCQFIFGVLTQLWSQAMRLRFQAQTNADPHQFSSPGSGIKGSVGFAALVALQASD